MGNEFPLFNAQVGSGRATGGPSINWQALGSDAGSRIGGAAGRALGTATMASPYVPASLKPYAPVLGQKLGSELGGYLGARAGQMAPKAIHSARQAISNAMGSNRGRMR